MAKVEKGREYPRGPKYTLGDHQDWVNIRLPLGKVVRERMRSENLVVVDDKETGGQAIAYVRDVRNQGKPIFIYREIKVKKNWFS